MILKDDKDEFLKRARWGRKYSKEMVTINFKNKVWKEQFDHDDDKDANPFYNVTIIMKALTTR